MDMSPVGPLGHFAMSLEREAMSDVSMLPDTPGALVRQWRSFDRDGSATGALINVGWMAVAACLAVLAEKAAVWGLSRRVRRRMRLRPEGPTLPGLLALLLCDAIGAVVFAAVFFYSRHWLTDAGVTASLLLLGFYALIRWRAACVVVRVLLRPRDPAARLIDLPDDEARRLARFLSRRAAGDHAAAGLRPVRAGGRRQRRAAHHRADRRRAGMRAVCADRLAAPARWRRP